MTRATAGPAKQTYVCVEFRYGDPLTHARYTNWSSTVSLGGEDFDPADGGLDVSIGTNTATFEQKTTTVSMSSELDAFVESAASGEPFPLTRLRIWEVVIDPISGLVTDEFLLFSGRVVATIKNAQGKSGSVTFEAVHAKNLLDVPSCLVASDQCAWTLGERGCAVNLAPLKQTVTVVAITGLQIQVSGLPDPAPDPRFWHRGYVERNGLRIGIRDWEASAHVYPELRQPAPAAWLGQAIVMVPGCDKIITTCRSRFNNEEKFCGFGFGMPSYNPIIEGP